MFQRLENHVEERQAENIMIIFIFALTYGFYRISFFHVFVLSIILLTP